MKEITFGETLSELLAISNVKVSQLADDLGYDISYISRWLHGTKLPSVKGRSPLFDKISKYLISGCSPEQKSEICRHLDLKTDLPDESLEKEIASALTDGYQSQLEQKKHRGSPIAGMNAHIADERTSYDHHLELLQNAISQTCRKPSLLPLEIIASLSVNDFTVDDCVAYFGGLHEICSGNRSINVSILLRKDIFSSPELICPDIIAYCCALPEDIHIDLYLDEEADDQSPTLWVCRDIAVQIAFNLSKQADRYSAISLDPDMISMMLVQSVINGFGSETLAGFSAAMRIESMCVVPMVGIGNALSSYTAQNIGAGKKERVIRGYHAANAMVIGCAIIICVVLESFHKPIIELFLGSSGTAAALETGNSYLMFMGWFFCLIGFKNAVDGLLRGAGDMKMFTVANLVNLIIRVALAMTLAPRFGIAFVWYAVPIGWFANWALSYARYRSNQWQPAVLSRSYS